MKFGRDLLYLSQENLKQCAMSMKTCIDVMEELHRKKGRGETFQPPKQIIRPYPDMFLQAMAAQIDPDGPVGAKWLSCCAGNPEKGLPRFTGFVILNDRETGAPYCVMDATWVTAMRTGAMSGLALRYLASPESSVLGVLGCGLEGRTNLEAALCECPGIRLVKAWGPRRATVEKYVEECLEKYPGIAFEISDTAEDAVRGSDVLLASSPMAKKDEFRIIEPDWCQDGLTAVPVNRDMHFKHETLKAFDHIYTDDLPSYQHRRTLGDFRDAPVIDGELSALLNGELGGRKSPSEKILFIADGLGINDLACGEWYYQKALRDGIGTMLEL